MAEIQIAWLELMTVGGLGVILVLLGVTFNIIIGVLLLNNMIFLEMESVPNLFQDLMELL